MQGIRNSTYARSDIIPTLFLKSTNQPDSQFLDRASFTEGFCLLMSCQIKPEILFWTIPLSVNKSWLYGSADGAKLSFDGELVPSSSSS